MKRRLQLHARPSQDRRSVRLAISATLLVAAVASQSVAGPPKLPTASPESVGIDSHRLANIERVINEAIEKKLLPGCVVLVARHGQIVHLKAFGRRSLEPAESPMTPDTLFDLASITKPVATATSVMILIEQGRLSLTDRVATHISEFGPNGKDRITVFQLLTHQSGLIADNPLADYEGKAAQSFENIARLKPVAEPGTKFIYSDVGFIVLGELVRRLTGIDVNAFSQAHVFAPLGMTETGYLPAESLRSRAAPSEKRDDKWIQGIVHDPRAHRLGGVAGHAGLFSTASDLAVYGQMMLNNGVYSGVRILNPRTVEVMCSAYPVSAGLRGLGWDKQTSYSINKGDLLSHRAFGHGGFTGTVIWIDPEHDMLVVFLSNRLHPAGKGLVNPLAGRIMNVAASAIVDGSSASKLRATSMGNALTGLDVLVRDEFKPLKGRRVGLITNHTGRTRDGRSVVELLHKAPHVKLVALYSPEHGFEGKLDARVADSTHKATGLPIYSLYGKSRQPTADSLRGIDVLVFDIQDIGTRFYTYFSTLGNALEAAAKREIAVVVLDRPNPIGGIAVEGPVLDAGLESFVGFHTIPVRHGMTVGELAAMVNAERKFGVDLKVVCAENWRREQLYDETGLAWVNPSPNMRNLMQAILYPGVGLLETTNVSVGRGTDTPFEIIGAPWMDGVRLASALNGAGLAGIRFIPVQFQPTASKYAGVICSGIQLHVTNRNQLQPLQIGLEVAVQLRRLHRDLWNAENLGRLLADSRVLDALLAGRTRPELVQLYQNELAHFMDRRRAFLLYP